MAKIDEFIIAHNKFQDESDKATDYLIDSWKLKGEDKQIALLFRQKHAKKALEYLHEANEVLKKITHE
jgi:hypothetical protein